MVDHAGGRDHLPLLLRFGGDLLVREFVCTDLHVGLGHVLRLLRAQIPRLQQPGFLQGARALLLGTRAAQIQIDNTEITSVVCALVCFGADRGPRTAYLISSA